MDERTQGALLLAVGGITVRLGVTDTALAYVKAGLQPALTVAGGVLVVLGIAALVLAFHGDAAQAHDDGHEHGPPVAWFLVLPLLALLLVAPPPLGAFAAGRQSTAPATTTQVSYPALPEPEEGAVPLTMTEFVFRALYDEARSVESERVRLSGFVTPTETGESYLLTRFTLNCCAADATAVVVEVTGDRPRAADTWLEVEGEWQPRPGVEPGDTTTEPPVLAASKVTEVPEPTQPYEY